MANFNKVLLMGNLTRDAELSYTPNQTAVASFGLAVNRNWTAQDGSKRSEACFVECTAWSKVAEVINKYANKKGTPLFVEGRLTLDQWEDQSGQKRSKLKVTVENVQLLPTGQQQQPHQAPGQQQQQQQATGQQVPGRSDDDIPF